MILTMKQIKEIYEAGIKRGNDESTSYEWGESPSGNKYDYLVDALHHIINHGITYDDANYKNYDIIEREVNGN